MESPTARTRAIGWASAGLIAVATLALCLLVLRWLAPQLIGLPADLTLVRSAKTLPPYYEGVFRAEPDAVFQVNDPRTVTRNRPRFLEDRGLGPHDHLGFRNHAIPTVADIVTLGDSQTYGVNARFGEDWPQRLARHLPAARPVIYNMATGGWGPVQYLDMARKAPVFWPRVMVMAFYTGNDSLEAFRVAHGASAWADLIVDDDLDAGDAPPVPWPPDPADNWEVRFADGSTTVFTPSLRLASNQAHPAVDEGYAITLRVARLAARIALDNDARPVFTIIPTKELAHATRVLAESLDPPPAYRELVTREAARVDDLAAGLAAIEGAHYVDVVAPLQAAIAKGGQYYDISVNGHPLAPGYDIIARTIAAPLAAWLEAPHRGVGLVRFADNDRRLTLVRPNGVWFFASPERLLDNGWSNQVPDVDPRALRGLPRCGLIRHTDRSRFGPEAARRHGPWCE